MPRRALLSQSKRDALLALPKTEDDWIRYYTLTEADIAVIAQHRGGHNRLGFAVQLCHLRHPGSVLQKGESPPMDLLAFVADLAQQTHRGFALATALIRRRERLRHQPEFARQ